MTNQALYSVAREAYEKAYAPYSGYHVGAAILGADGNIYSGCNVENVSFGLAICAERSAVVKMVGAGCREVEEVVLVSRDLATPCGVCRQTLAEFVTNPQKVKIHCVSVDTQEERSFTLDELFPNGFTSEKLIKIECK